MNIKKFLFNNFGLKVMALLLAFFVWTMISGRQRSYSERTLDINVEYTNVAENIDVRSVRPDKVRLVLFGTSKELEKINPADFKVKIDLKNVTEGTRLNYFSEDHLVSPEGIDIKDKDIQPRMIEIIVKEFVTREVPVRIRYKGRMPSGVRLVDRQLIPEKVKIFGYKSQIGSISMLEGAEFINLSEIEENKTIIVPLKKDKEILRFEGPDEIKVVVTVENKNKNADQREQSAQPKEQ